MNLTLVLASCIALLVCNGNAIPTVPRDNSHYVEGTSRYIWMADDNGETHLVDLQAPIETKGLNNNDEVNNKYWLFTRSNPHNPQLIAEGNINSIWNSNYLIGNSLNVVVHGWHGSLTSEMNTLITSALLAAGNVNVIVVDWSSLAVSDYLSAARNTVRVGEAIGRFVVWLVNATGGNWNNVHLIGFSLGAHAVGSAGHIANGRARRITGLDPAGPGWHTVTHTINPDAGRYVQVIHTDVGAMGLLPVRGHSDYYPNGGRLQPGCDTNQCSHSRAWKLYASSVRTNHFIGRQCANLNEALLIECKGAQARMGNSILSSRSEGIFGLVTGDSWPF